jgi:hypothetical protein
MPTREQRQAACTHLNVTRLFDPFNSNKCHMCGHTSSFGWLYRCTQDYNSFLPESDFALTEPQKLNCRLSEQAISSHLSQSVLQGIENGHYSAQQVSLLKAQKLLVRKVIAMQEEGLETLSDSSHTTGSLSSSDSALESSILLTDETPNAAQHRSTESINLPATEPVGNHEAAYLLLPVMCKDDIYVEPLFPDCHFACCHSCRPAYRDRAFQSLNAILAEPVNPPPQWELENRRISDARILKRIGMPLHRPYLRRVDQKLDDLRHRTGDLPLGSNDNGDVVSGIEVTKGKIRRRSGFRETVRKALGAIDQSKYRAKSNRSSKRSSRSSSRESLIQIPRPALFRRRKKQEEGENAIVSNKALQESLALMLAVNTPLPRASEDSDSLNGGEVKVEDGVAVTEEGVEMSAADILTQV